MNAASGLGVRLRGLGGRPLAHFVLLGALLLTVRRELDGAHPPEATVRRDPIVVSREREHALAQEFQRRWNAPPSAAERRALVAQAVDDEMLFREARVLALELGDRSIRRRLVEKMRLVGDRPGRGEDALVRDALALGLDDDAVIRRLMIEKMRIVLRRGAGDMPVDAPISDDELAAYLESHREELEQPARLTFTQVFLAADARGAHLDRDARRMLTRLRSAGTVSDEEVATLSDPFPLGTRLRSYTHAQVLGRFGKPFAEAVARLERGKWSAPLSSPFGVHLVRVDERVPARLPALAEVRPAVTRAVMRERSEQRLARGLAHLRDLYRVRFEADDAQAAARPFGGDAS